MTAVAEIKPVRGRYLISISAAMAKDGVVVHDTRGLTPECDIEAIGPRDRSYFRNLDWAIKEKGYAPCPHCMAWLLAPQDYPTAVPNAQDSS